jgi:hypothetical protein
LIFSQRLLATETPRLRETAGDCLFFLNDGIAFLAS